MSDTATNQETVATNTPVEHHEVSGRTILVKREDQCCSKPGPSFSKMRGVLAHIRHRPEQVIGVLDTYHSMAGWGVAFACARLGRQCVNFYPTYLSEGKALRPQQRAAERLGASMRPLSAGRSCVLYHLAKRQLAVEFENAYLMPNALKLLETVTETAAEVARTTVQADHWVVSASSGTIASGILLGLLESRWPQLPTVWVHQGYSRPVRPFRRYIEAHVLRGGWPWALARLDKMMWNIVDEGYEYKEKARGKVPVPFPCNIWYDAKAWHWLTCHPDELSGSTLFWNIGA